MNQPVIKWSRRSKRVLALGVGRVVSRRGGQCLSYVWGRSNTTSASSSRPTGTRQLSTVGSRDAVGGGRDGEANRFLEQHVQEAGLGHEHFWTSGTDQGEEGRFFWMSNGQPVTFTNWNAGEPNNFQYENGEMEHCLELWNRDGKGLKWNDSPCSFETFFICEV
ncbi:hypothetical protein Pcinc_018899 [Petrolisthes cinctipes]|uniref:C-type lectin domain-containing protein n=1 Tax=Petrolisthes cinctipes TaxID=88211 RepID=A0AAE1KIG7_PETCI|nr:hypothetical protein Pcinc_018899 [Petrolisthes cinctipes]